MFKTLARERLIVRRIGRTCIAVRRKCSALIDDLSDTFANGGLDSPNVNMSLAGNDRVCVTWQGNGRRYQIKVFDEAKFWPRIYFVTGTKFEFQLDDMERFSIRVRRRKSGLYFGPWSDQFFAVVTRSFYDSNVKALRVSMNKSRLAGTNLPLELYQNIDAISDAISKSETTLVSFPFALSLILEGRGCNFKCFYCSHILPGSYLEVKEEDTLTKGYKFPKGGKLSAPYVSRETVGTPKALIDDMVQNLPKLRTVMFGGSEPLLYPEFRDVVERLQHAPHVQCSVCTNGSLLDVKLADFMTNANFPWVRVSIDGATSQTFEKIRKGKYEKVVNNLKRLRWLRDKKGRDTPLLQFNFVVCRSNYHEIPKLVHLAREIGVSQINYKMLISGGVKAVFIPEDPLQDRGICVEIIDLMGDAANLARRFGISLTREAVTPAIYERHPDLLDPMLRDRIRQEEKPTIAACKKQREEETGDSKGPLALADYYKESGQALAIESNRSNPNRKRENKRLELAEDNAPTKINSKRDAKQDLGDIARLIDEEDSFEQELEKGDNTGVNWSKIFCHQPFINMSVGHHRTTFCCFAKGYYNATFAGEDLKLEEIWNNPRFVEARQHMLEGRADLVCKATCPHLTHGGLKNVLVRDREAGQWQKTSSSWFSDASTHVGR